MGLYSAFKTDKDAEKKGVILNYSADNFRVTVARAGGANKRFEKALDRIRTPHKRAIQTEKIDLETATAILMEAYAEAIVVNWETCTDKEKDTWVSGIEQEGTDELLTVNKENLLKTFKNLPDVFQDIRSQAEKENLFLASVREANAKN